MSEVPDAILSAATLYITHGVSVIPVSKDKKPFTSWKKYQQQGMTRDELQKEIQSYPNPKIAVVCGRASQGLEIIDFDLEGEKYHEWVSLVEQDSPGLLARLWIERTPSGGYHVAYRIDPDTIEGNKKLAKKRIEVNGPGEHEYKGKKYTAIEYKGRYYIYPTAIETRGEGGYCVVSPSDGYHLIQPGDGGPFYQFPQITPQERGCLIRCAKALGDVKLNDIIDVQRSGNNRRGLPGEDFNDRYEGTLSLLLENGWEIYRKIGNMHHLRRPGKNEGCSATLFDGKVLHVFSSNAEPFEEDRSYSPFAVYTLLKHGSDFSAAASDLNRQGFGEKEESIEFDGADPIDIFGDTSLFGSPDWPDNVCPSVIDDFARDTARRIGVKVEMVAMPCIGAAAIAIPDNFKIQPKVHDTTWTESPRIWIGIIADAGQKKTPALLAAVEPLKRLEIQYFNQYKEAMTQYQQDYKFYEKRMKDGGDMTEPVKPEHRRLIADDSTVEALRNVLEVNSNGVGIIKDELSGWITSFDAYRQSRGKDRADFCELYQGGAKLFDRAEKGHTYVPNWGASIIGGIQPGPVARLFGNITDDGLLARFLVCHVNRQGKGEDITPNMAALCQYRFAIERLTGLKPTTEDRQIFTFSDSATKYRAAVVEICECVQRLPDTPDALKAHLNKFEAAFCRIALIFHLIESAHLDQPPGLRISEQTARMAARLITDFLLPNSIRFYHETIDTGSHNAHAKWVANYILSKGVAEVVRSQLVRDYRPFFKTPNLLDHTLRTLETCGWVEPSKTKKAGTVTRWKVNPRAHEKFVERAKEEAERRKNERLKIQKAAQKLRMSRKGADHVND